MVGKEKVSFVLHFSTPTPVVVNFFVRSFFLESFLETQPIRQAKAPPKPSHPSNSFYQAQQTHSWDPTTSLQTVRGERNYLYNDTQETNVMLSVHYHQQILTLYYWQI